MANRQSFLDISRMWAGAGPTAACTQIHLHAFDLGAIEQHGSCHVFRKGEIPASNEASTWHSNCLPYSNCFSLADRALTMRALARWGLKRGSKNHEDGYGLLSSHSRLKTR